MIAQYLLDDGGSHKVEFVNILHPAGFFVHRVEKLERSGPDTYILKVERRIPKVHSEGISGGDTPPACPGVSYCEDALNRRNRES